MQSIDEKKVIKKIFMRIVPLLMILYAVTYVARINVGFAALTMNQDIGLSAYTYSLGAGIFFIGYFLFEVPSNLLLEKYGARQWIARIIFTVGILACCMSLVQGTNSFIVMRFLLGIAEAGFFPGVVFYLTYWFPVRYRARVIAAFSLAIPISIALGAPISTLILEMNQILGIKGWQWLFVLEGLPAVLGTIAVLKWLDDRPKNATWLTEDERTWLEKELEKDLPKTGIRSKFSVIREVLMNPTVLLLAFIYFCAISTNLGLSFFLPQIIKQQGFGTISVGFLSAIPYIAGCVGMIIIGYFSDYFNERRWHLVMTMLMAASGLGVAAYTTSSTISIMALSVAAIGILGCKGPFWALPSSYFSGASAAGGIAFINAVGNLGGFAGPYIVGALRSTSEDYVSGLYALAVIAILAAIIIVMFIRSPQKSKLAISNDSDKKVVS